MVAAGITVQPSRGSESPLPVPCRHEKQASLSLIRKIASRLQQEDLVVRHRNKLDTHTGLSMPNTIALELNTIFMRREVSNQYVISDRGERSPPIIPFKR